MCWKGLAQTKVIEFAERNRNVETYVVRPGGVLGSKGSVLLPVLGRLLPMVSVGMLGAVMVDLAVNGGGEGELVQNKEILERGRELLKKWE